MALDPLLGTVGRFVCERLVPLEDTVAENDAVPADIVDEMRALGLFGFALPEEYGGLGLTMEEEVLLAFELGQTSPAFRSVVGTNNGIGGQGIVLDGTDEQKTRYLPKLAAGEIVGAFALTEPEAGPDAGSLRTTARRDGDSYVLNGTKRYITNAPEADLFTVFARTDPQTIDARGVSAFLVEARTAGLSIGRSDHKMGQHGAHTADVIFDDCRVPATALLGGVENAGFRTAMKVLDRGRLHISAVAVGAAERLIRDSLAYAVDRKQFGQPIAEFQLVQAMLADSKAEACTARCMGWTRPAAATPGKTSARWRRAASCLPPRWSAASPTGWCRSTAAPATSPTTGSNACFGMSGCSASMRERRRSSSSSWRGT